MKQLFALIFLFPPLITCSQQKIYHEIKIYLEDGETRKKIDNAKVTKKRQR